MAESDIWNDLRSSMATSSASSSDTSADSSATAAATAATPSEPSPEVTQPTSTEPPLASPDGEPRESDEQDQVDSPPAEDAQTEAEGAEAAPPTEESSDDDAEFRELPPKARPAWRGYRSKAREFEALQREVGGPDALKSAVELDRLYRDTTKDPIEFAQRLYDRSPSQFATLISQIAKTYPDFILSEIAGSEVSADQVRDVLAGLGSRGTTATTPATPTTATTATTPTTTTTSTAQPDTAQPTPSAADIARRILNDELSTDDERRLAREVLEASNLKQKSTTTESELTQLKEELNALREWRQSREQSEHQAKVHSLSQKFVDEAKSFAASVLDEIGLKSSDPSDPEHQYKERARERILDRLLVAFDTDPQNQMVGQNVLNYANRLEEKNLYAQLPYIKVWIDNYVKREAKPDLDMIERGRQRQAQEATARSARKEVSGNGQVSRPQPLQLDPRDPWGSLTENMRRESGRHTGI